MYKYPLSVAGDNFIYICCTSTYKSLNTIIDYVGKKYLFYIIKFRVEYCQI